MVGAALRTPPADLTAIAGKNGGTFPDGMIIEFIDGTRDVLAHGPRAMPVWGLIFQNCEMIRKSVFKKILYERGAGSSGESPRRGSSLRWSVATAHNPCSAVGSD
jgi:hypothetical protein